MDMQVNQIYFHMNDLRLRIDVCSLCLAARYLYSVPLHHLWNLWRRRRVVFSLWTKQLASNAAVMTIDRFYDTKPVVIGKERCSAFC